MKVFMTERMLAGAKKDFEKRLRNHFPYFRDESIVDGVMRDFPRMHHTMESKIIFLRV